MQSKRGFVSIPLIVLAMLMAGTPLRAQKFERTVVGRVTDVGGEPLARVVVQLTDRTTLQVWSRITDRDGKYDFAGLSSETDYELRVHYRGKFSKPKTVSKLNPRKTVTVDFRIEVPEM